MFLRPGELRISNSVNFCLDCHGCMFDRPWSRIYTYLNIPSLRVDPPRFQRSDGSNSGIHLRYVTTVGSKFGPGLHKGFPLMYATRYYRYLINLLRRLHETKKMHTQYPACAKRSRLSQAVTVARG
jgi:hypothetical protein